MNVVNADKPSSLDKSLFSEAVRSLRVDSAMELAHSIWGQTLRCGYKVSEEETVQANGEGSSLAVHVSMAARETVFAGWCLFRCESSESRRGGVIPCTWLLGASIKPPCPLVRCLGAL